VGLADASAERAAVVAQRYHAAALDDYRLLLGAVDAVTVAVPTVLHREVAGAFLERGVATLVEKPMAGTLRCGTGAD
jgi:predicted dehydrogenase